MLQQYFNNNIISILSGIYSTDIRNKHFILALSGGLDSVVLLHLLHSFLQSNDFNIKLSAVYIDHNLQEDSKKWIEFNRDVCARYDVQYQFYSVNVRLYNNYDSENNKQSDKNSLEAAAREARYSVFKELIIDNNHILLTAQHLNDQAETFFLQLMRAAGPKGLSSMPIVKKFANGFHVRPLLKQPRSILSEYAKIHNLTWVEDSTNQSMKYDRNYIRTKIIDDLSIRWPHALQAIYKTTRHCAEQEHLLSDYIKQDYNSCVSNNDLKISAYKILDITVLKKLDYIRLKAIIRYWYADNTGISLGQKALDEIIKTCVCSSNDAKPKVVLNGKKYVVSKKGNLLFLKSINDLGYKDLEI